MEIDVSIIIVNYKTYELVRNCIDSIYKHSEGFTYEIIVVDNNSNDGSTENLKKKYTNVKVIENRKNVGFGKANNIGVNYASGKYYFFLNSDTLLLNNAIKYLYEYYKEKEQTIGVVGCWLKNEQFEVTSSAGKFMSFKQYIQPIINVYKEKIINSKTIYENNNIVQLEKCKEREVSVDYVFGADMFISRKKFYQVGKFDEDFFMYWEETYLQYLLKNNKYENILINTPQIIHLQGKSSKRSLKMQAIEDRSMYLYLKKTRGLIRTFPFMIIFVLLQCFPYFKNESKSEIKEYFYWIRKKNE